VSTGVSRREGARGCHPSRLGSWVELALAREPAGQPVCQAGQHPAAHEGAPSLAIEREGCDALLLEPSRHKDLLRPAAEERDGHWAKMKSNLRLGSNGSLTGTFFAVLLVVL